MAYGVDKHQSLGSVVLSRHSFSTSNAFSAVRITQKVEVFAMERSSLLRDPKTINAFLMQPNIFDVMLTQPHLRDT